MTVGLVVKLKNRTFGAFRILIASNFARGAAVLTLGTGIAQIISILTTPVLSRIFTSGDFGLLALYGAIVSIFATFISLRYEIRVVLPKKENEAQSILFLVVWLALILGTLFALVSLAIPQDIYKWMGIAELGLWSTAAVIASIFTVITTVITNWFSRRGQYKLIAGLRVTVAIIMAVTALCIGFLAIHNGLLISQFVVTLAGFFLFVYFCKKSIQHHSSISEISQVFRIHQQAPRYWS